jgi:anti-sigma factor RsiW
MARNQVFAVTDDDLNAFIDGALDPFYAAGIAAAVYGDPVKAETVAAYRAQNSGLKALYGHVADEELPAGMAALLEAARPRLRQAC